MTFVDKGASRSSSYGTGAVPPGSNHRSLLRRVAIFLLGLAAMGAAWGCGRSDEERAVDALLHAADALRDAPSEPLAARVALLDALERTAAADGAAAGARDTCVHAYRLLLDARSSEARVRQLLADPAPHGAEALSELADFASAEAKIKESAAVMPKCDTALAELRRAARRAR